MNIVSAAWQWMFPARSFAIELRGDVPTMVNAISARIKPSFYDPFFYSGCVGRATERVVKVRYQRAWQANSFAPVFVGRFRNEQGRWYLVGRCQARAFTRVFQAFWLGFVFLWWMLALTATLSESRSGMPLAIVLTVPPLMLAFGFGLAWFGRRLAKEDFVQIQSVLTAAAGPAPEHALANER